MVSMVSMIVVLDDWDLQSNNLKQLPRGLKKDFWFINGDNTISPRTEQVKWGDGWLGRDLAKLAKAGVTGEVFVEVTDKIYWKYVLAGGYVERYIWRNSFGYQLVEILE